MKREQILTKAQKYLIKYSNSTSKYYEELRKTYNEYKELDNTDPVINKLYAKQLNKLCIFVEESENFLSFLVTLIIVIIVIIILVSYTTVKVINTKEKVNVVIEKANSEVSLDVKTYTKDFKLSYASDNYKELYPIYLELNPRSKDKFNIVYNIYLDINNFNGDINNLKYVVTIDNNDYIYSLKDRSIVLDKYLIYTNNMKINDYKKIQLRIYDTNPDDDLSVFDYSLSYDAYLE